MVTMTRAAFAVTLLIAASRMGSAQTCVPIEVPPMFRQADPASPSHADGDYVPDGEVWIVRAAGIGTYQYVGPSLEYKLQIERAIYWPNGSYAGTWLIPLAVNENLVNGTPMLALTRSVIMMPKERLVARVNSPSAGLLINLFYLALKVPIACLDRVMLHGGEAVSTAPDTSAMRAAALTLKGAVTAFLAALPQ